MRWLTSITTQAHARFPSNLDAHGPSHKLSTTLTLQQGWYQSSQKYSTKFACRVRGRIFLWNILLAFVMEDDRMVSKISVRKSKSRENKAIRDAHLRTPQDKFKTTMFKNSSQGNPMKTRQLCKNNRGPFFPQMINLIISVTCLNSRAIILIFSSKTRQRILSRSMSVSLPWCQSNTTWYC